MMEEGVALAAVAGVEEGKEWAKQPLQGLRRGLNSWAEQPLQVLRRGLDDGAEQPSQVVGGG